MKFLTTLPIIVFVLGFGQAILRADTINFEGLPDGTGVSTQYPGLTFTSAIILTAGISLNEFEFPPHSGVNVVSDNGGFITIAFSAPVTSFSGYFTYLMPLTLTAFDSGPNQLGQSFSAFSSNLALSGDPGSSPNEFLALNFPVGISSLTIAGDPTGGSFVLDDLTYSPLASSTPEPGSIFLFLTGIAVLTAVRTTKNIMKTKLIIGGLAILVLSAEGTLLLRATPNPAPPQAVTPTPDSQLQRMPRPTPSGNMTPSSPISVPTLALGQSSATSTHTVGTPVLAPSTVIVSTLTLVVITSRITDPTLISNSVNVLLLGATGTQPTILGVMHDDGLNGDSAAGDHVYTLQKQLNEPATGFLRLQVSAAFVGELRRSTSTVAAIGIWGAASTSTSSITFPPSLQIVSSSPSSILLQTTALQLAPSGAATGLGQYASSGYAIDLEDVAWTNSPFDINAFVAKQFPGSPPTMTPLTTIKGLPAFLVEFSGESGDYPATVVVASGTTVHMFSLSFAKLNQQQFSVAEDDLIQTALTIQPR